MCAAGSDDDVSIETGAGGRQGAVIALFAPGGQHHVIPGANRGMPEPGVDAVRNDREQSRVDRELPLVPLLLSRGVDDQRLGALLSLKQAEEGALGRSQQMMRDGDVGGPPAEASQRQSQRYAQVLPIAEDHFIVVEKGPSHAYLAGRSIPGSAAGSDAEPRP